MAKYKEPNVPIDTLKAMDNIIHYQGYYVRSDGVIYNKHGHKMTPYKNVNGTWVIMLRNGHERICPSVNRFVYQAFHQDEILTNVRVSSNLNNDYEIDNGWSEKPVFDLNDIVLTKTIPGGNLKTKEYKSTYMQHKQDIIDKRNEYMKHPRRFKREIELLDWVLGRDKEDIWEERK